MWAKILYQMEILNPIFMTPNMTVLTRMAIWNTNFALSNEM